MSSTSERGGNVSKPTSSPNAGKIPDGTREDDRRKGETRQIAGEGGDRAPQKQHEKSDPRRAGGPGHADAETREPDPDADRAVLGRTAEGRR